MDPRLGRTSHWKFDLTTRLGNSEDHVQVEDGREFVLVPLNVFDTLGPNGAHKCVVLPIAGPSIHEQAEKSTSSHLPLAVAKKAIWQIAKGLDYLHRNGIGHGGKSSGHCNADMKLNKLRK